MGSNNRNMRIRNYRKIGTIVSNTIEPNTAQGSCTSRVNNDISILHIFIICVFTQGIFIKIQRQSDINAGVFRIALLSKDKCTALLNIFWRFPPTNFFDATVF